MSIRKKVLTVVGAASASSLFAGLAAFAPTKVFAWFMLTVLVCWVLAFVLWMVWDHGYGEGWTDHSEGRLR